MNKYVFLIFLIFGTLLIAGCSQTPRACTEEAKICPDGTAVGRVGPNCEFEKCPEIQNNGKVPCGGWDTSGTVICACEGIYEKTPCPSGAVCDSAIYYCYGNCGECKCYTGPEDPENEIPCAGREKFYK